MHGNVYNFKLEGFRRYNFTKFNPELDEEKDFSIAWPKFTFQSDYDVQGTYESNDTQKSVNSKGSFK